MATMSRSLVAHASRPSRPRTRPGNILAGLAKIVVEAALDAELAEHLESDRRQAPRGGRSNSRNGVRTKTVATRFGPIQIDVPRDRWGSFEPVTVGKWQRGVIGIDQLLLLLLAKGAPAEQALALLRRVYPAQASDRTLSRIAATVRARLTSWHQRSFDQPFQVVEVHRTALRDTSGRLVGYPVIALIGAGTGHDGATRRELLAVHAVGPAQERAFSLHAVLRDLRERGLTGVRHVVTDDRTALGRDVEALWPGATNITKPLSLAS